MHEGPISRQQAALEIDTGNGLSQLVSATHTQLIFQQGLKAFGAAGEKMQRLLGVGHK
jgi:hypothetical protein